MPSSEFFPHRKPKLSCFLSLDLWRREVDVRGGRGMWRAGAWSWKVSQPRAWFSPFRYLQGNASIWNQASWLPRTRRANEESPWVLSTVCHFSCIISGLLASSGEIYHARLQLSHLNSRGCGFWLNSTSSWSQIRFRRCRSARRAEVNSSLVSSPLHLFFLSTVNFSFTVFPP